MKDRHRRLHGQPALFKDRGQAARSVCSLMVTWYSLVGHGHGGEWGAAVVDDDSRLVRRLEGG